MIAEPAMPSAGPVVRRSAADVELLEAGAPQLREPFVVTDADRLMSEVWQWTPDRLRELIGTEELAATLPGPDGRFQYEPGRGLSSQPLSVQRFFEDTATSDGPRWCLQQVSVKDRLPVLAERLDYPSCVPDGLISVVNLWMAAADTVTPLHYDDTHNVFAQVSGTKTFYLFPPEDMAALYPGPLNTGAQHLAGVDMFEPDYARHPGAQGLAYRTATVSAGEVLVLPAFWWHQVASRGVSISVNFWWRGHVRDCLCPGFIRQLQSTPYLDGLSALLRTFELGEKGEDPAVGVGELLELLDGLGETRAAAALATSVLRTAEQRPETAGRAGDLLAAHADLDPGLVPAVLDFVSEGNLSC